MNGKGRPEGRPDKVPTTRSNCSVLVGPLSDFRGVAIALIATHGGTIAVEAGSAQVSQTGRSTGRVPAVSIGEATLTLAQAREVHEALGAMIGLLDEALDAS